MTTNNKPVAQFTRAWFAAQGRLGAAKRQAGLTGEQRAAIARKAADARWSKAKATTNKQ